MVFHLLCSVFRLELQREREKQKEAEVEALKRSMQSGMVLNTLMKTLIAY